MAAWEDAFDSLGPEGKQIKADFKTAFKNIKPTDAVIVGMYQQFGDQVGANAALVRELGKAQP